MLFWRYIFLVRYAFDENELLEKVYKQILLDKLSLNKGFTVHDLHHYQTFKLCRKCVFSIKKR